MKIVYFAHSVLCRGGDKMVLAHLGHLAASGHQVVITSNTVNTIFPIHPAIRVVKPRFGSKLGTLISALIQRQEADCVIASIVSTAVFLSLRNRGRVIHFAQDDNETAYDASLLRYAVRFLYFLAFSVFTIPTITVSHALAESFNERFGANCRVVCNGVDTNIFFRSPSNDLLIAKGERKSILILSRSDPRKGLDIARQVVAELARKSSVPLEVWTVGEELSWNAVTIINRHFGTVNQSALCELLSSADVFLYPSSFEGFGLMALEAFACGCPVVTTEAISFSRDNENALVSKIKDVCSLAENVMRIFEDELVANKITDGGYKFAQNNLLVKSSIQFEKELYSLCKISG